MSSRLGFPRWTLFCLLGGALSAGCSSPREDEENLSAELDRFRALPYLATASEAHLVAGTGVVTADPGRYSNGYNLFQDYGEAVYLMSMRGEMAHRWDLEGRGQIEYASLLPGGDLLVVGTNEFLRVGWDSQIVFERHGPYHHDVEPLADGSFLVLTKDLENYHGRKVWFDRIEHTSSGGETIDSWSTWDYREQLQRLHPPSKLDAADESGSTQLFDYYHTNAIRVLPGTPLGRRDRRFRPGNWLLCSRHADLIYVLDADTREITWSWGPGELDGPHYPTMRLDGKILLFDNGAQRGFSRLLLFDPLETRIVWSYQTDPVEEFYSNIRGAVQQLPNGNLLVTESEKARVFEISADGEVVWDYRHPPGVDGERHSIYRMLRYPVELVEDLRRSHE